MRRLGLHAYALTLAAVAAGAAEALSGRPAPLAPALAAGLAYTATGSPGLAAALAYATAALAGWPASLLAAYAALVALAATPEPRLARSSLIPLAAAPLYAVYPEAGLAAAAWLAAALAAYAYSASAASRARASVSPPAVRGRTGSEARLTVDCRGPAGLECYALLDGAPAGPVPCPGRGGVGVRLSRAGVWRVRVEVRCRGPLGLAEAVAGRGEVTVRSVPEWRAVVARAAARLASHPAPAPRAALYRPAGAPGGAWGGLPGRVAWILSRLTRPGGRPGEYLGVREYRPGDDPRDIHWKKTASRRTLMVKMYERGGGAAGGVAVLVDLRAVSHAELDRLVNEAYSAVASIPGEGFLYIRLPGGEYAASGPRGALEALLTSVLSTEDVEPRTDYEPAPTPTPGPREAAEMLSSPGLPGALAAYYMRAVRGPASMAAEALGPGGSYVIVHGAAGRLWAAFASLALEEAGLSPALTAGEEAGLPPRGR